MQVGSVLWMGGASTEVMRAVGPIQASVSPHPASGDIAQGRGLGWSTHRATTPGPGKEGAGPPRASLRTATPLLQGSVLSS